MIKCIKIERGNVFMTDVNEMTRSEIIKTLIRFAHRDEDELLDMDDDTLYGEASEFIDIFDEILRNDIEQSNLIDLDDPELSIYDVLAEWEDINDVSDLYPNGQDE